VGLKLTGCTLSVLYMGQIEEPKGLYLALQKSIIDWLKPIIDKFYDLNQ